MDKKDFINLIFEAKECADKNKTNFSISTNTISIDEPLVARGASVLKFAQSNSSEIITKFIYYNFLSENVDDENDFKEIIKYQNVLLNPEMLIDKLNLEELKNIPITYTVNNERQLLEFHKETGEVVSVPFSTIYENVDEWVTNDESLYDKVKADIKTINTVVQSNYLVVSGVVVDTDVDVKQINESLSKLTNFLTDDEIESSDETTFEDDINNNINIKHYIIIIVLLLCVFLLAILTIIYVYFPELLSKKDNL